MTLIFVALFGICLFLFVYPYFVYPWVLSKIPKNIEPTGEKDATSLQIALMFCAFNEENSLPSKIENLRQIKNRYPAVEILAYSDCSTDRTNDLLRDAGDILRFVQSSERLGKATGMKTLVAKTSADIVVFCDANVLLDIEAIEILQKYFSDPSVGTVAGRLVYTNSGDSETSAIGDLYWKLEEKIKYLESSTGSTMGADGSIFATRRVFYPDVPPNLLDDLIVSIEPLFQGYRVISAPDVLAFERLTTNFSDELNRKRRIACRAFNTHRYLWPKLRKMSSLNLFKYISHKVIRWFGAYFITLGFVFFSVAVINSVGFLNFCLAFLFIGGGVFFALQRKVSMALKLLEILGAIFATGYGVFESILGKDYQIWVPPESRST